MQGWSSNEVKFGATKKGRFSIRTRRFVPSANGLSTARSVLFDACLHDTSVRLELPEMAGSAR